MRVSLSTKQEPSAMPLIGRFRQRIGHSDLNSGCVHTTLSVFQRLRRPTLASELVVSRDALRGL